jgi:hypothetical protein
MVSYRGRFSVTSKGSCLAQRNGKSKTWADLPAELQRAFLSHPLAVLALLVAVLMALAWLNRFVQDDAFISFRYARNLAHGNGLTFN